MASVVLSNRTDGKERYRYRVSLGGTLFDLEFFWNERDSSWSVLFSDTSGNQLLSKKIALRSPLLLASADPRLPVGEIFAVDTTGSDVEPGLTDLGSRVRLVFTDAADILALA